MKNLEIADAYYLAMNNKDKNGMERLLHPDVKFISPITELIGKKAVLKWIEDFLPKFESAIVRAKFANEHQAMLAYDLVFPAPIGRYRAASLIDFQDGLIRKIELFFDTGPISKGQR